MSTRPRNILRPFVEKIVQLQSEGDPSIDLLLLRCPWLTKVDWVNRCAPERWAPVVSSLSTNQLEWLIKAIVTAEHHLKWAGGSGSSAIHLFRLYAKRDDCDLRQLADWLLRNRGRNNYLPFGFMTAARSLAEWYSEQKETEKRHEAQLLRESREQEAKARRLQTAQDLHVARRKRSAQRKRQLTVILAQLRETPAQKRLAFIAKRRTLPLEAIPNDLIEPSVTTAHLLEPVLRASLLKRIDRRKTGVWKVLRRMWK